MHHVLFGAHVATPTCLHPPPMGPQILQQAPRQATVWGFVPTGQSVTVGFDGQTIPATTGEWVGANTWIATLPRTLGSLTTMYNITATSNGVTITLKNVLFGEVWVCSGQCESTNLLFSMCFVVGSVCAVDWNVHVLVEFPCIDDGTMHSQHTRALCWIAANMEYPLGHAGCWNASNTDCAVSDAQCIYGCVNNSDAEVAAMADYPSMRVSSHFDPPI
jgi:hypothetical protein